MKKITETHLKCRGIVCGNTRKTDTTVPLKSKKGITLIALVITIIVLLILAGVTINIIFNQGIIEKSQTAVDKYSEESAREKLSLAIFNYKMGVITGEAGEGEGKKTFSEYIEEIGGTVTHNEGTYTVILDGYEFTVDDSTYEITSNGGTTGGTETPVIPEVKKYTITYDANGGTGSMEAGEKTEGTAYTIASNGFTAATGYAFKEWNTQADGKGTKYTENQSYSTEANLTLYAIWYKNVYNVGDTFTVNGETFYVIKTSDANTETVEGLAALNIDTKSKLDSGEENPKYLKQSSSAGTIAFCSNETYTALGSFTEGEDLNAKTTVKEDPTSAVYYAMQYAANLGENLGATGRLMTADEVVALGGDSIYFSSSGCPQWINATTKYWIGTAQGSSGAVWYVDGSLGEFGDRYGLLYVNQMRGAPSYYNF